MGYLNGYIDLLYAIFGLLLWVPGGVSGFVFGDSCLAPPSCHCSSTSINCNYLSLVDVPKFPHIPHTIAAQAKDFYVYMTANKFTTIPGRVFEDIHLTSKTKLHLSMDVNHISSINPDAFVGVENVTYSINLNGNNLTTIPAAIGTLNGLNTLYINSNPLKHLDGSTMSLIGKSLGSLWINMNSFHSWPHELNQFKNLESLTMDNIPFVSLPVDSFNGIGTRLESMTFNYPMFTAISPDLCTLKSLNSFTVRNAIKLSKTPSLFNPCQHLMTNFSFVTIVESGLTSLPNILTSFPSVKHIDLQHNNISSFDHHLVPDENDIRSLTLNFNRLTRVPDSVIKMKNIRSLELKHNNITEITDTDLAGLTYLYTLDINQNPLQHVSDHALDGLVSLGELDMSNTNMTTIPAAILSLPSLYMLPYMGNPVHCTCNMSYLKSWNISAVPFFTGFCENNPLGSTLLKYLKGPLKNCP